MSLLGIGIIFVVLLYGCTELASRIDCEKHGRANCTQDIEPD